MSKIYINLLFLVFSTIPFQLLSGVEYNSNIEKAHQLLFNLEFSELNLILEKEHSINPKNVYIDYIKSYEFFLKSYFDAHSSDFNTFIEQSNHCIELLDHETNTSEAALLSASLSIQQAFLYFLWDEKMSYVKALVKGQGYIDKVNKTNPEYLKIASIYEVIGGSVPSKYKTVAQWFNIKGNPNRGIKMIDQYLKNSKSNSIKKVEGEIIQLYLRHFVGLETHEKQNFNSENILYAYIYLSSSNASAKQKLDWISELKITHKTLPLYFQFLKARYLLESQDQRGIAEMDVFLNQHKGVSFIHTGHFYKAWYYCSQNETSNFSHEKAFIKKLTNPIFPIDKKLLSRIEDPSFNASLVKARMLFDAGEFNKALVVLQNEAVKASLKTSESKIEYVYRMARIYEKLNNTDLALSLYERVIKTKQTHLYFVAYSAYCSAKIYEGKEDAKTAILYYKKSLELNEGEYQKSIAQKCHFALNNLDK